jgi:hypothetical protein
MSADLRFLLALVALIFLLIVAASLGFTFDRSDWNEKEQEQDTAHPREEPAEDHQALRPAAQAANVQNDAGENHRNGNQASFEDRQLRVAIGLTIATLAIAIPTTLGLIILYGTLNATKIQGDILIAASRAWMVPTDHKASGLNISLSFLNAGNSPAINLYGMTEYALGSDVTVPIPHFAEDCAHLKSKQPAPTKTSFPIVLVKDSFAIDPIQDVPDEWSAEATPNAQPPLFRASPEISIDPTVRTLLIHGCVWYTDVLSNQERTTEFYFEATRNRPAGSSQDVVNVYPYNPFTPGHDTPYLFH